MSNRLLRPQEAADLLGIKKSTLYKYSMQRLLPRVKLPSGALRFREDELQKLIEEHSEPARA